MSVTFIFTLSLAMLCAASAFAALQHRLPEVYIILNGNFEEKPDPRYLMKTRVYNMKFTVGDAKKWLSWINDG
ncbi:hypothetical protein ACSQ67_021991 [Phaseolus vulgaris]